MDSSCSYNSHDVESLETRALAALLDAFHPCFSLEEIASAYCRAGSDLTKAGEILCESQESVMGTAVIKQDCATNLALHEDSADCSNHFNSKGTKPKKLTASVGSISSVLGKSYSRSISSKKELLEPTKPLKWEVKGSMLNGSEVDLPKSDSVHSKQELCDMEDFLSAMLGTGFQLSRDVIREVLGDCGYDMKKGMEELLAMSAKALTNGKLIDSFTEENCTGSLPKCKSCIPEERLQRGLTEQTALEKDLSNLSRELLLSMFNAPDRSEEPRKRLEWGLNRTRVAGRVVTKPPCDIDFLPPTNFFGMMQPDVDHVADQNDNYQALRIAAKEHWEKMKEFYKAAIDAFSDGDHPKANNLLEEGRRHNQMAREAEEHSAKLILKSKNSEVQSDVPLDLHTHSAKESVDLLKQHLKMLANNVFRYLKVTVNTDMEDSTKGRRKRLVIKLLERESIKWTEEVGNPGTIVIDLMEIDPNKLSFRDDQSSF
ncbi:putative nuclear RNA export factor SDE5 [Iris pallida]|uniref:Nuclear RNA export factor SDE5 n=1 Tax=Iris pallida TaxID=29817 RepID=A0AAX6FDN6_IRIPA|nr:putative nuclear RNA export factor SDE5 [Iris pallida]